MEMTKSVVAGIRPRSLFASAAPVVLTLSLLRASHGVSPFRIDGMCAVAIAVLVQMLANLNAVYSTFHRAFNPMKASTTNKDNKIVINLLSQKLMRLWSWLFFILIVVLIGVAQLSGRKKKIHVAGTFAVLAVVSFLYCRRTKPLPVLGLQEVIFSLAFGPIAMGCTAALVIGSVPFAVVLYAIAVMFFAFAYQIVQSIADAPFAHRLGVSQSSLAGALGYDMAFKSFVLFVTCTYALLAMSIVALGHLPNLLLLLTMSSVRDISDAFREEKLQDLAERMSKLGAQLSAGLVLSVWVSSFIA